MGYAELVDKHHVPAPVSSEWRRMPLSVVKCGVTIGLTNDDSPILPISVLPDSAGPARPTDRRFASVHYSAAAWG
jgi:hypothetical protein